MEPCEFSLGDLHTTSYRSSRSTGESVVAESWAVPPSAALKRRPANSESTIDRPTGFDIKPSLWPVPFPVPRWNPGRFTSLVAGKSRSTSSFHVHTVGRMEERAGALQPAAEAVRAGPVPTRRDTAYRVARPQDTRGQGDPAGRGYAIRYSPILLAAPRMIFSLDAKPASPPVSHLAPFDSRRHADAGHTQVRTLGSPPEGGRIAATSGSPAASSGNGLAPPLISSPIQSPIPASKTSERPPQT